MFRPFPASLTPSPEQECKQCGKRPHFWYHFCVRIVSAVEEYDVYQPGCGCNFFVESFRTFSFFASGDYARNPMDVAKEIFKVSAGPAGYLIGPDPASRPKVQVCDGVCEVCPIGQALEELEQELEQEEQENKEDKTGDAIDNFLDDLFSGDLSNLIDGLD